MLAAHHIVAKRRSAALMSVNQCPRDELPSPINNKHFSFRRLFNLRGPGRRYERPCSRGVNASKLAEPKDKWEAGKLLQVRTGLYFTSYAETPLDALPKTARVYGDKTVVNNLLHLSVDDLCSYDSYCLDFGPFNLANTARFCQSLALLTRCKAFPFTSAKRIVVYTRDSPEAMTNAAFAICAHLMIYEGFTAAEAWKPFATIAPDPFLAYHDATWLKNNFELHVLDCLQGIERGMSLSWIRPRLTAYDSQSYEYYDHPLNGDIHEVIPGKFIAFAGPAGKEEVHRDKYKTFDPDFYAEIFRQMGVTDVVRLNVRENNEYAPSQFTRHGFVHHDLIFDDCTTPPDYISQRFLELSEKATGLVAVHCKAGLGRTGTLIALYMMKHMSFTARESIGWLRFMRPGSVIHTQQSYLVEMQPIMASGKTLADGDPRVNASNAKAISRAHVVKRKPDGVVMAGSPFASQSSGQEQILEAPDTSRVADELPVLSSRDSFGLSIVRDGLRTGSNSTRADSKSMTTDSSNTTTGNNSTSWTTDETMTHALDADSFQSLDSRTAADFCEVLELSSSELADMVSLDNTNSMRRRAADRGSLPSPCRSPASSPCRSPSAGDNTPNGSMRACDLNQLLSPKSENKLLLWSMGERKLWSTSNFPHVLSRTGSRETFEPQGESPPQTPPQSPPGSPLKSLRAKVIHSNLAKLGGSGTSVFPSLGSVPPGTAKTRLFL